MNSTGLIQIAKNARERLLALYGEYGLPRELLESICISAEDAEALANRIYSRKPRSILEVGSYVGISTGLISLISPDNSKIVAVDPGLSIQSDAERFGFDISKPTTFYFERMIHDLNLRGRICLITGYFADLPDQMTIDFHIAYNPDMKQIPIVLERVSKMGPYDFVFLDADHHAASVCKDLEAIEGLIAESSEVALHDFTGNWGEQVREGVQRFLKNSKSGLQLDRTPTLGLLSRDL